MNASPSHALSTASSTAEAISEGGRAGTLRTPDGPFAPPPGSAGPEPDPELLFAGAYAACFHSAILGVAGKLGIQLTGSILQAKVGLVEDETGGKRLAVELHASMPGVEPHQARNLMEEAHKICPYSKALRGDAVVALVLD